MPHYTEVARGIARNLDGLSLAELLDQCEDFGLSMAIPPEISSTPEKTEFVRRRLENFLEQRAPALSPLE